MTLPLISFAVAIAVLALTPGPGVFAVLGRALGGGIRPALWTIGGIVLGDLLFLALAASGLSLLAHSLGDLFFVVRIAGGLYLVWLGIKAWRYRPETAFMPTTRHRSGLRDGVAGFLLTLGNPKVILFYAGFLPTFLPVEQLSLFQWGQIAVIVALVLGLCLSVYALTADRLRHWVVRPRARRRLNQVAGGVMIGTGAIVLSRPL